MSDDDHQAFGIGVSMFPQGNKASMRTEGQSLGDQQLRDQIAASLMPAAIEVALKGYGHFCDNVYDRACRDSFEAAERWGAYRHRRYGVVEKTLIPEAKQRTAKMEDREVGSTWEQGSRAERVAREIAQSLIITQGMEYAEANRFADAFVTAQAIWLKRMGEYHE